MKSRKFYKQHEHRKTLMGIVMTNRKDKIKTVTFLNFSENRYQNFYSIVRTLDQKTRGIHVRGYMLKSPLFYVSKRNIYIYI